MSDPEATPEPPSPTAALRDLELWQKLAIGGGVLLVLGSFLPWVRITAPLVGTVSQSGIDGSDGWFSVLMGAAVIAVALTAYPAAGQKPVALYVLGGLALLLAIFDWIDIAGTKGEVEGMALVSVGIGLYVVIAGALGAIAAGVVLQRRPT